MRILILANERFVYQSVNPLDLAEALAKDGHSVFVAAPFGEGVAEANGGRGFGCIQLPTRSGRAANLVFWAAALAGAARVRPDVVVGVNAVGLVAADLAKLMRFARATSWYSLELSLPDEHRSSLSVRWQAWRGRACDFVIATGRRRAEEMAEQFRLARSPFVIANAPLRAPRPDRSSLRQQAVASGLQASQYVVYAGSNGTVNCLVEAAKASALWGSDAGLVLAVFGGTREEVAALHEAAAEPGTRAVVVPPISGGRAAVLEWLAGADAGLVLFDHRTTGSKNLLWCTPNKLLDYIASGLPVVASDNPSLVEDVQAAGIGRCCDPRSPASIAAAVDAVLEHRSTMAETARRLFSEELNYDRQTAQFRAAVAGLWS